MLGKSLTKKISDHSDGEQFTFGFHCDRCGKEWKSLPVPFTSGGFTVIEHEEARALLWAKEHQAAFDGANLEAHLNFNHCPACNRWLCDECFCTGEARDELENRENCRDCQGDKQINPQG